MKRHFSNRQLLALLFPLLVEQLLAMLVGMFDTMMVSRVGEAAVSGVSIVNDVNNLAIQLLSALAGGGAVCVSQYLGNSDDENTKKSSGQLIMISALISTGLGLICLAFHKQILGALYGSVEESVMKAAITYFWITAISFPFLGLYNAGAALYRSMNETRTTMYVSVLVNAINLVGNYVGIFIFKLGVVGVAVPTLVSRAVGAVIMIALSFDRRKLIYVKLKDIFSWNQKLISKILSIAIPNGIEMGLFQFGKIMVSTFVATYGTVQIAANGVSQSLATLCYATEMSFNLGIVTVIGRCVGANDYDAAKYYIKKMVLWAYVSAIVNNVLVYVMTPYALKLYSLSSSAVTLANTIMLMECVAVSLLHPLAFPLPCALRASGDARYTMVVGVTSMFLARVACAYFFGTIMGLGAVGTRFGMYIDWVVRIVFFIGRYRSGKWMNYRIV